MSDKILGQTVNSLCWCGKRILERVELPQRRGGYNFEFTHDTLRYHVSVRALAGQPVELFLNCGKIDSGADLVARDAAVIISVMLQYGIPLSVMASSALGKNPDGSPSSPIGKLLEILLKESQNAK